MARLTQDGLGGWDDGPGDYLRPDHASPSLQVAKDSSSYHITIFPVFILYQGALSLLLLLMYTALLQFLPQSVIRGNLFQL